MPTKSTTKAAETATETKPTETVKSTETVKPAETKPTETKATETVKPAFSWDDLPEPEAVKFTAGGASIYTRDVAKETPEIVKARVDASYDLYVGKAGESTDKKVLTEAGRVATYRQECGTPERAAEFLKLATKYAKFMERTLRGAVDVKNPTQVVFKVKPAETRMRKSAAKPEAKPETPATK